MLLNSSELESFMSLQVDVMNGDTWIYTENRI